MKGTPILAALGLVLSCTPAQISRSVVVGTPAAQQALVGSADDFSPGDIVHVWGRRCSRAHPSHCGLHFVGNGVVSMVVVDAPQTALIQVEPTTAIALGDRVVKDSPMFYWHPDPPSE